MICAACYGTFERGSGAGTIVRIEVLWKRAGDGMMWNGTGWGRALSWKPASVAFAAGRFSSSSGPGTRDLRDGVYYLYAAGVSSNGRRVSSGIAVRVDVTGPSVAFQAPREGQSVLSLARIVGTAYDKAGVARVLVGIRREGDAKFWNGTSWVSGSLLREASLSGALTANTTREWVMNDGPPAAQLEPGEYALLAYARDALGNETAAFVRVQVPRPQPTPTPTATIEPTATPTPTPTAVPTPTAEPGPGKIAFVSTRDGQTEIYAMNIDGSNQTRLTHTDLLGLHTQLDISRTGREIVFAFGARGARYTDGPSYRYDDNLYLMNARGGELRQLTFDAASLGGYGYADPQMSPDEQRIVCVRNRDICVLDRDGGNLRVLTSGDTYYIYRNHPYWSADGRRIVFRELYQENDSYYERLIQIDADGTNRQVLQIVDRTLEFLIASPDGQRVAYRQYTSGGSEAILAASDLDGSNLVAITSTPQHRLSEADWSPDSRALAYSAFEDRYPDIFVAEGGTTRRLTDHWAADTNPSWGPGFVAASTPPVLPEAPAAQNAIAFSQENVISCWRGCSKTRDIHLMNADGSNERRLSFTEGEDTDPAISPNGRLIAFVSDRDGNPEIFLMDTLGQNVRQLTVTAPGQRVFGKLQGGVVHSRPAWSPDGTHVVYARDGDIVLHPINGNAPAILTSGAPVDASPSWHPNGNRIAFVRDGALYVMNADGSNPTALLASAAPISDPAYSPDGNFLAYVQDNSLSKIAADLSSAPVLLAGANAETNQPPRRPTWSPDGSRLAFYTPSIFRQHSYGGDFIRGMIFTVRSDGTDLQRLRDTSLSEGLSWR